MLFACTYYYLWLCICLYVFISMAWRVIAKAPVHSRTRPRMYAYVWVRICVCFYSFELVCFIYMKSDNSSSSWYVICCTYTRLWIKFILSYLIHLWTESCPLYIFHHTSQIHFIFTRGRRLMHEHVLMHLPAWWPCEAVGKQASCG